MSFGQTIHNSGRNKYVNVVDANNDTMRLFINTFNDNGTDTMWARCAVDSGGVSMSYDMLTGSNYDSQKSDSGFVFRYVCGSDKLNLKMIQ